MANTTSTEYEPHALTNLITVRRQELGLTRAQLVKRAGYKNVTKGTPIVSAAGVLLNCFI